MLSIEKRPLMLEIWSATVSLPKIPIDEVYDETTTSGWLIHGTKQCIEFVPGIESQALGVEEALGSLLLWTETTGQ